MIDVKQPIRKSFYQCLNGNLTSPLSTSVGVYDDVQKLSDSTLLYVLLEGQSGTPSNNQTMFKSHEDIIVSVVQKDPARVAKSEVDFVAAQILNLVLPHPQTTGLPAQSGLQILDVQVAQDLYDSFVLQNGNAVMRRSITFEMDAIQTQS